MAIPDTSFTIQDGNLGSSPGSAGNTSVTIGVCSKGIVGTLYSFTSPGQIASSIGYGPGPEALALKLAESGGTQHFMPVTPTFDGAASTITKVGTGVGTLSTPTFAPTETITVTCTTAGNNGTAKFTFAIGSGATSAPVTSVAGATWVYQVAGTLTKITFTEGSGFDATDAWTISNVQVVVQTTNPGPGSGSLAHTSSQPLDYYSGRVV